MSKPQTVTVDMIRRANRRIMDRCGAPVEYPRYVNFLGNRINVEVPFDREKLYAAIERVNERRRRY